MKISVILCAWILFCLAEAAWSQQTVCTPFLEKFCAKNKNQPDEAVKCLIQHDKELSTECKQEMQRWAQGRGQAARRGGGALSGFGGANAMGPTLPLISYEGRHSGKEPSLVENKMNISSPVVKKESETYGLSLALGHLKWGAPITLSSGKILPAELSRVEIGGQFHKQLPERKSWGWRFSVGSAGDKLFSYFRDTSFSLSAHYGFPGEGRGYWMWVVFVSNNSSILNYVPIPGFVYVYRGENFTSIVGVPFASFQWTPVPPWALSVSVFGPTLNSEVTYGEVDQLQSFLGVAWTRQSFILSDRQLIKDRLTLEEKKAWVGLRKPLYESMMAELQVGYVFDRSVYIGDGFSNKDRGEAGIASDSFVNLSVKAIF